MTKAGNYIQRASGLDASAAADKAAAGDQAMGGLVLEALLKSGMPSKVIAAHIPVLTAAELKQFTGRVDNLRRQRDADHTSKAGRSSDDLAELALDFGEIEWACRLLGVSSDDLPRIARVLTRSSEPLVEKYQAFMKSLGKGHR